MLYGLFKFPHRSNDLVVLNYHSTPQWLLPEFEKQVQFYSRHFEIISPPGLDSFYNSNQQSSGKPKLLFTFDDGLKNNLLAAKVLEKYKAAGIFFLVPDFYNAPPGEQKNYYLTHIRNQVNFDIDTGISDVTALDESEIRQLIHNGHRIGCHSKTHTLNAGDTSEKSISEIISSKKILEEQFNIRIIDFCAPFDSLQSTNRSQMDLIKENYRFYHATFPGSNAEEPEPFFIRRTNVECWWPLEVIKFALSGFEWRRWEPKRAQFRKEVLGKK